LDNTSIKISAYVSILAFLPTYSKNVLSLEYIAENPNKDAVADVFMERLRTLGNENG
jgi:hypothetical protein